MTDEVAVAILAGGEGSRIGGNKPTRLLAGKRLIDRALDQGRRWSDLVMVSARDSAALDLGEVPIILDEPNVAGPLAGLVSALRFGGTSGCDFVLVIPADMPFLPKDLLDRLLGAIGDSGCALASSGGQLHPVCGLWRTSAADQLGKYLAGQHRSLRGFASMVGFREVEWAAGPLDPFFNINSEGDLAEAERRAAG